MNDYIPIHLDTLKRVAQFAIDHPLTPPIPAATNAFDAVNHAITRVQALDSTRLHGHGKFRGAAAERQVLRKILRSTLSDLSRVSKTLHKTEHPDLAAQLKMGRLNTYAELLALARNAITVITPILSVFIDHGAPATILQDIQDQIDDLVAAGGRSFSGRGTRIASNADLRVAIRAGMEQVRILDGILSLRLKSTPGLVAEWKAAMRLRRSSPSVENDQPSSEPQPLVATAHQQTFDKPNHYLIVEPPAATYGEDNFTLQGASTPPSITPPGNGNPSPDSPSHSRSSPSFESRPPQRSSRHPRSPSP